MFRYVRRVWFSAQAILALMFLVTFGCAAPQSNQPAISTQVPKPSQTATGAGAKPVVIGFSAPLTGALAEAIKPEVNAHKLWEKEVNERGGLLGRPVQLEYLDNKSDPDTAVSVYQKLVQQGVDFAIEAGGSGIAQRTSTIAEQSGKLFLTVGTARVLFERGYKNIFLAAPAVSEESTYSLFEALKAMPPDQRPKTIAYVTLDSPSYAGGVQGLQQLLKPLNIREVLNITYPPSINDATPFVQNLKDSKAELVYQNGNTNDTVLFIRAIKQQGLEAKMLVVSLVAASLPNFYEMVGDAAEQVVYHGLWEPEAKTKGIAEFVNAYREFYGTDPNYLSACAYSSLQIIEQAVNATISLDQAVLRDYVAKNEFVTVVGTLKYNDQGYPAPKSLPLVQWQKGKRVLIAPQDQATGQLIYPRTAK